MPNTTTTPVDSAPPTPSWSPRNTISAAISALEMNETTNTRSLKIPSNQARSPPNTASSAATTAIGRYGCIHNGMVGSTNNPASTPNSRPMRTITWYRSPALGRFGRGRALARLLRLLSGEGQAELAGGGQRKVGAGGHLEPDRVVLSQAAQPQPGRSVHKARLQRARVADRLDQVRSAQRAVPDQDRVARGADRGQWSDPLPVDRDRLRTGQPQAVDQLLQVGVVDPVAHILGSTGRGRVVHHHPDPVAGSGHGLRGLLQRGHIRGQPAAGRGQSQLRPGGRADLRARLGEGPFQLLEPCGLLFDPVH